MNSSEKINEEYLNKIISAAYGDAGIIDKIKLYLDSKKYPEVKKILEEYRKTAHEVHSLKHEEYKEAIPVYHPQSSNLLLLYLKLFFRRPFLSTALTLLLIAGLISGYLLMNEKPQPKKYSAEEIRTAEQQAKESFVIVASILNKAENRLKNDVLDKKVNQPIQKNLIIINNYLKGE